MGIKLMLVYLSQGRGQNCSTAMQRGVSVVMPQELLVHWVRVLMGLRLGLGQLDGDPAAFFMMLRSQGGL